MKKGFSLLAICACFVFLLSGCVATSVNTESNAIAAEKATLANVKTFAWFQPVPVQTASYDKDFSGNLDNNLRKALVATLQQKGLLQTTLKPDVLISYDLSVAVPREKDSPEHYMEGFGYGYAHMAGYRYNYLNPDVLGYRSVDLYKQGTLIIDIIDPATNTLIWRGWSEGAITNPKAKYNKIQEEVKKVLQKLELK